MSEQVWNQIEWNLQVQRGYERRFIKMVLLFTEKMMRGHAARPNRVLILGGRRV